MRAVAKTFLSTSTLAVGCYGVAMRGAAHLSDLVAMQLNSVSSVVIGGTGAISGFYAS